MKPITIALLDQIIGNPLRVQRFSTQKMTSFLRGTPKPSLPFGSDLLKIFIEIFKGENEKRDKRDRCITVAIPNEIAMVDYDTLLNFVKKHCDKTNSTSLAQLILSAAREFILMFPNSEWHEFMMLRQLRETLKFSDSSDYEARIAEREKAVMTRLLQKRYLLEQEEINFSLLLGSEANQEASLAERAAALYALSSYHISSASMIGGRFNSHAQDNKNFRMLLKISSIKAIDNSVGLSFDGIPLAAQPAGILSPDTVQVFTENGLTVAQPKNIGLHWENFLVQLRNPENNNSPIALMTFILKQLCEKNDVDNHYWSVLLNWFHIIKEYTEIRTAENENIFIAQRSYADLYRFLSSYKRLPQDALPPIVTDIAANDDASAADDDASAADDDVNEVFDFEVKVKPYVATRKRSPVKTPQLLRKKPKQLLDVIMEGDNSNENSPEIDENHGRMSASSEWNVSQRILFGKNLETHQGSASLASLRFQEIGQVDEDAVFDEDEQGEDDEHFYENERAEEATVLDELEDNEQIDENNNQVEEDDMLDDDELFDEYHQEESDNVEYPNLPSESEFAEELIQQIEAYYSSEKSQIEKYQVVDNIIELVVEFVGESTYSEAASQSIRSLNNAKNQAVTLETIFIYLYHILYAVVLSIPADQAEEEDGLNSYYFHANAALIQLNQRISSGKLMAHTAFIQQMDRVNELPIQQIMYRSSKKSGEDVTGEALKKQSHRWSVYYQNLDDTNFQSERYQKEAWCVLLIVEILRKKSEDLSIEERGLVVDAINAALKEDCSTPVYNAMFFLAATYNGSREEEVPIISLNDELIEHRMVQLCKHLFAHIHLTHQDDAYIEALSDQQKIIYQNIEKFLTLYELRSGQVDVENFDHETMSVSSRLTGTSRQSNLSRLSAYTFRSSSSTGSRNSTYSRGNAFAERVIDAGASTFWSQLFVSEKPLDKKEVKFILKGYMATCEVEELKHGLANAVLHRAFDWLHVLPSTKSYVSSSWSSKFSASAQLVDVASENWQGLTPYLAKKGHEAAFVAYCAYQAECKKQENYVLTTYEIDFITDNIKILYSHCYMEPLWNDIMVLISKTLDAKLSALEQNKKLNTKDVKRYQKILTKEDGEMIDFLLTSASGENSSVVERVNALFAKAIPEPEEGPKATKSGIFGRRR